MGKSRRFQLSLIALWVLVAVVTVVSQTPLERQQQIRSAVDSGDTNKALAELAAFQQADPNVFNANNCDYLQGRLAESNGDTTHATAAYQSLVARKSMLAQYALWRLAQLARSIGDLVLERERLRQLIATSATSILREAAQLRLGESFIESSDFESALAALAPVVQSKKVALAREASVLVGQSYQQLGKNAEAQATFQKLIMQMPDASRPDDFALLAVRGLDALEATPAASSKSANPTLSEADRLLRASIYQFNRDFAGARQHYLALMRDFPQSTTVPNAVYQTGRGFYLEAKYDEALKYFQRVVQEFPNSSSARDALTSLAATYNRLGRPNEAVQTYQQLISRFPDPQNPERAYLNIIDILHEAGRYPEALSWVQRARSQFKGQIGDALTLFAQLRIHQAQADWQAVVNDADELLKLSDLGGTRIPGGTTKPEITFIRARALENLGRDAEAIAAYLSLPAGRNEYYGTRATQRLLAMGGSARSRSLIQDRFNSLRDEAKRAAAAGQYDQARVAAQSAWRLTSDANARGELRKILVTAYSSLPAYQLPSFTLLPFGRQQLLTAPAEQTIADELFFLGLYDEAIPEYTAARATATPAAPVEKTATTSKSDTTTTPSGLSDRDYSLAVYSLRGAAANRAVRFGEQLWRSVPADYVLDVAPRDLVELLYPTPYRDSLLRHAPSRNVDARFVLSIARQESRFQADAKSIAAARGMMQFIPATADEVAGQLGRKQSNHDELYNADTAILFGSQYLATLFKQFPDQPQAVASAYNGGPDNTARWIARSRSNDPDRYVPEIGFSQTKDYVYKVLSNYWAYEELYDSQLQSKTLSNK
jgi:soluble lytic murein transglycosylase-like protein/TolA-binding protein